MGQKPTTAFVLSLIGGIIYLLIGVIVAAVSSVLGGMAGMTGFPGIGMGVAIIGSVGLISGIVMIVGAAMLYSPETGRVRTGSVLVLIFTIVGALFTFGGIIVGFILALIGSILGLTWKPSVPVAPPPAPTV